MSALIAMETLALCVTMISALLYFDLCINCYSESIINFLITCCEEKSCFSSPSKRTVMSAASLREEVLSLFNAWRGCCGVLLFLYSVIFTKVRETGSGLVSEASLYRWTHNKKKCSDPFIYSAVCAVDRVLRILETRSRTHWSHS